MSSDNAPVYELDAVGRVFVGSRRLRRRVQEVVAVEDVSLRIERDETLALVGASGSGKTTTMRMLAGLDAPTSGVIRFEGEPMRAIDVRWRRAYARKVGIVFQNPLGQLNPRHTVRRIVETPLRLEGWGRGQRAERVAALLEQVGLDPAAHPQRYPRELSGGQAQRVAIARAIALEPHVLLADEPLSSLDVSVGAAILDLLAELRARLGLTLVLVTHDLGLAGAVSDRIAVMSGGRLVELGATGRVLNRPEHAYTRELLDAVPKMPRRRATPLEGSG